MKNILIAAGLIILSLSGAAMDAHADLITSPAHPALIGGHVITFEGQRDGKYFILTVGPVTFSNGPFEIGSSSYGTPVTRGGPHLSNGIYNNFYNPQFVFNFGENIRAFGFWLGGSSQEWYLTAYDAYSTMLDQIYISSAAGSHGGAFYGISTPGKSIAYAILSTSAEPGDFVFIDDFTTGPVTP